MTEIIAHKFADIAPRIFLGIATEDELGAIKRDDVYAIKADDQEMHVRTVLRAPEEAGKRRRRYVASDESVDRMGDVIRQAGWDHKDFKRNPVALWAHNDKGFPIGTVHDIEIGERGGVPTLYETIEYFEADVSADADKVYRIVEAGGIKAVSVGFRPLKAHVPKDEEERKGLGLGPLGIEYRKQAQLELSNCSVPAHQNALAVKSICKGALAEMVKRKEITKAQAEEFAARLEEGERKVFAVNFEAAKADENGSEVGANTTDNGAERQVLTTRADLVAAVREALVPSQDMTARDSALAQKVASLEAQLEALTARVEQIHKAQLERSAGSGQADEDVDEDDPLGLVRSVVNHVLTRTGDETDG